MSVFFFASGLVVLLTPQVLAWGTLSRTACLTSGSGGEVEAEEMEGAPPGGNSVHPGYAPPPPWTHGPGDTRLWNSAPSWGSNAVNNTHPYPGPYPQPPYPQSHHYPHHRHTSTEEEFEVRRKRAHGYPPSLPPITGSLFCPEGVRNRIHIRRVWTGYAPGPGSCESGWPHCKAELSPGELAGCEGQAEMCMVRVAARHMQYCSQPSNYVHVQYECIDISRKVDMCTWRQGELMGSALVTSHRFPGGDVIPANITQTCECHVQAEGLMLAWADGELEAGPEGKGCGREAVLLEERTNGTWTLREEICGAGSLQSSHVPVKGGELRMTYLAAGPLSLGPNRRGVFMKLMAEDRWASPGRIHVSCREMKNQGRDPRLTGSPASTVPATPLPGTTSNHATSFAATPSPDTSVGTTPPERAFPANPRFRMTPRPQSTATPTIGSRPRHHLPKLPIQETLAAPVPTKSRVPPSEPRLRGGLAFRLNLQTPPPPPYIPPTTTPPPPPPPYFPQTTTPPPPPPMPETTTTGPIGNGMDDTSLNAVRRPPPSNPRSANRGQTVTMTTTEPPQIHPPAYPRNRHGRIRGENSAAGAGAVHGEEGAEAKPLKGNAGHTTAAIIACVASIMVIVASIGGYVLCKRRRALLQQLKENVEGGSLRSEPWTVSSVAGDATWDSPVYNDPANPSPPPLPNRPPTLPRVKGKKTRVPPAPPTVGVVSEAPPIEGVYNVATPILTTQASMNQATPLLTSVSNPTPYAFMPDSEVGAEARYSPGPEYEEPVKPLGQGTSGGGAAAAGRGGRGSGERVYDNNMEPRYHEPTFEGYEEAREIDYAQIVDMQKIVLE